MSGAPLPECPFPGEMHRTGMGGWGTKRWVIECESDDHSISVQGSSEAEVRAKWDRLTASPPLPESVVRVLLAAEDLTAGPDHYTRDRLFIAVGAFLRAGRPGAPKVADQVKE